MSDWNIVTSIHLVLLRQIVPPWRHIAPYRPTTYRPHCLEHFFTCTSIQHLIVPRPRGVFSPLRLGSAHRTKLETVGICCLGTGTTFTFLIDDQTLGPSSMPCLGSERRSVCSPTISNLARATLRVQVHPLTQREPLGIVGTEWLTSGSCHSCNCLQYQERSFRVSIEQP